MIPPYIFFHIFLKNSYLLITEKKINVNTSASREGIEPSFQSPNRDIRAILAALLKNSFPEKDSSPLFNRVPSRIIGRARLRK